MPPLVHIAVRPLPARGVFVERTPDLVLIIIDPAFDPALRPRLRELLTPDEYRVTKSEVVRAWLREPWACGERRDDAALAS